MHARSLISSPIKRSAHNAYALDALSRRAVVSLLPGATPGQGRPTGTSVFGPTLTDASIGGRANSPTDCAIAWGVGGQFFALSLTQQYRPEGTRSDSGSQRSTAQAVSP